MEDMRLRPRLKQPRLQLVINCYGEPVTEGLLYHLQNYVMQLLGSEKGQGFWITRPDLYYDYMNRNQSIHMMDEKKNINCERFHTPTFDFYLIDRIDDVPVGSLVNVKIPEADS